MPRYTMLQSALFLWLGLLAVASAKQPSRHRNKKSRQRRGQQANRSYNVTLSSWTLGRPNPDVAAGNPLKGLVESPIYTNPPYSADIPLSVEFYYIGLNELMVGNPNNVGDAAAYTWATLDNHLAGSASRNMHAVVRVILEFPTQASKIPQYLFDEGMDFRAYWGGVTPNYSDYRLLQALEQFIAAFGKRYDGDKRLGFVQAGLLGFWGEWHTYGSETDLLPWDVGEQVIGWYKAAFPKTQIQLRYQRASGYAAGFGRHDDSFAFNTLDGEDNGGVDAFYYFWPNVEANNETDFWRRGAMGGETRGEVAWIVFEDSYPAGTYEKQDFNLCVKVTHATYMFHHAAWKDGGFSGSELVNAKFAHARMGYNFVVSSVSARQSSNAAGSSLDVDVTIQQTGVAPFYYDLGLGLRCTGWSKRVIAGVNTIMDTGSTKVFKYTNVPATKECLDVLTLSLESTYAYPGRPIKFAQGRNNGTVTFSLPLPDAATPPTRSAPVVARPVAPTPVASSVGTPKVPTRSPIRWVPSPAKVSRPVVVTQQGSTPPPSELTRGEEIIPSPTPRPNNVPPVSPRVTTLRPPTGQPQRTGPIDPTMKPTLPDITIPATRGMVLDAPWTAEEMLTENFVTMSSPTSAPA